MKTTSGIITTATCSPTEAAAEAAKHKTNPIRTDEMCSLGAMVARQNEASCRFFLFLNWRLKPFVKYGTMDI